MEEERRKEERRRGGGGGEPPNDVIRTESSELSKNPDAQCKVYLPTSQVVQDFFH